MLCQPGQNIYQASHEKNRRLLEVSESWQHFLISSERAEARWYFCGWGLTSIFSDHTAAWKRVKRECTTTFVHLHVFTTFIFKLVIFRFNSSKDELLVILSTPHPINIFQQTSSAHCLSLLFLNMQSDMFGARKISDINLRFSWQANDAKCIPQPLKFANVRWKITGKIQQQLNKFSSLKCNVDFFTNNKDRMA